MNKLMAGPGRISGSEGYGGQVLLAHGDGGLLTRRLIEELFLASFDNPELHPLLDAARIRMNSRNLAFTTDSHVVSPLFFPKSDIGRLSVFGSCNDLAVMGARPECLSCGFILEEGLEFEVLERVVQSMQEAAASVPVKIVTGDTKVVERGAADRIFINTSGVGPRLPWPSLGRVIKPGDVMIVSGSLGDHGIAILAARGNLALKVPVESDCASIWPLVEALYRNKTGVKWMRDPTRGGLATALNELVIGTNLAVAINEENIPVKASVDSACEILGLDPLYMANEGKLLLVVKSGDAERALEVLKSEPLGQDAAIIGRIEKEPPGKVVLRTSIGGSRLLGLLSGNPLPRIC
jgi:hydrogenase expression/formation protein HypE